MPDMRPPRDAALPDLPVLSLMSDVERAIAIVDGSRLTHVHWRDWRRNGGEGDENAGDLAHHEQAIRDYDHVLTVLRDIKVEAEARSIPVAELNVDAVAAWLHKNASTRRRITCGPDSKGCRLSHRLDAQEILALAADPAVRTEGHDE